MKATIKLLVVVDTAITYLDQVEEALEKQRQDYLNGTDNELDITWIIKRQDLSGLNWIEYGYGKDNYGVEIKWLENDVKDKIGTYSIAYVIDENNWTDKGNQGIWGWSISLPDTVHIQLIKGMKGNVTAMYWTFLMELMHSWDNLYFKITRKRLEDVFMVSNYDEDIIHGKLPEYDAFQYIEVIRKMKDILIDLFKISNKTMYGILVKGHPNRDKIYFVRKHKRHHINSAELLTTLFKWDEVISISREKWDKLEVGEPIGFISKGRIITHLRRLLNI